MAHETSVSDRAEASNAQTGAAGANARERTRAHPRPAHEYVRMFDLCECARDCRERRERVPADECEHKNARLHAAEQYAEDVGM